MLDIFYDCREAMNRPKITVMEIGSKNILEIWELGPDQLSALHLKHTYISAEQAGKILAGEDGEMNMIRHYHILERL